MCSFYCQIISHRVDIPRIVYSWTSGCLSCFCLPAVRSNAAVSTPVHVFRGTDPFLSLGCIPGRTVARSHTNSAFDLVFSTAAASSYIPPSSFCGVQPLELLHILVVPTGLLDAAVSVGTKWDPTVALICASLGLRMLSLLSCAYWPFLSLFGEMSVQILWSVFSWVVFLLLSYRSSCPFLTTELESAIPRTSPGSLCWEMVCRDRTEGRHSPCYYLVTRLVSLRQNTSGVFTGTSNSHSGPPRFSLNLLKPVS